MFTRIGMAIVVALVLGATSAAMAAPKVLTFSPSPLIKPCVMDEGQGRVSPCNGGGN